MTETNSFRNDRAVLLVAVILAAAVRVTGWDTSLWIDEIATVERYARLAPWQIVSSYGTGEGNNHVFHTLLVHLSTSLFGEAEWAVRLPAVLLGVATIPAFFWLAAMLWPARIAAWGALLLAASYPHAYYSQTARGYSIFLFFAVVATALAIRFAVEEVSRREGVLYAAAIALGTWTLPLMAFVAVGHGLVLGRLGKRQALAWLALGVAVAGFLYAPMLSGLQVYFADPGETGHGLLTAAFWEELRPVALPIVAATLPGLALTIRLIRRRPRASALILAPVVVTLAAVLIRGQGVHPRSFMFVLLVAHLIAVEGVAWLDDRSRRGAVTAVAAATTIMAGLTIRHSDLPRQPFREAARDVVALAEPGEPIVGISLAGQGLRYYSDSVRVARTVGEARTALEGASRGWVAVTLGEELRSYAPELADWVGRETTQCRTLEGRVDGGAVHIRLWRRRATDDLEPEPCTPQRDE